jgi:hypothetical protein
MAVRLSALLAGRPLPPRRMILLMSVRGQADPRNIVQLEELSQLKNPVTSSVIEPEIYQLLAFVSPVRTLLCTPFSVQMNLFVVAPNDLGLTRTHQHVQA